MKTVEFEGVQHQFPDDFTDQEISDALQAAHNGPGQPQAPAQGPPSQTPQGAFYDIARTLGPGRLLPPASQLPTGLGAVGGLVPGPLGILTAGAGGGIGEAGSEALQGQPLSPQKIAGQAGYQAALQAGGLGLAKGAGLAGRVVMESGIGRGIPGVAKTALEEGIRTTRGGMSRLLRRIGLSGEQTLEHAAAAGRAGVRFSASDVTRGTVPLVRQTSAEAALPGPTKKVIAKLNDQFIEGHSAPITPQRLIKIRQNLDNMAKPIWKAIGKNEPVTAVQQAKAQWAKAMRDQIENLLHGIPEHGANIAASDARTAQLIRVKEAIQPTVKAFKPFLPRLVPGTIGAAVGGALPAHSAPERGIHSALGALATSPAALSSLALLLNDPTFAALLTQAPRGAAGALEPDTTRAAR